MPACALLVAAATAATSLAFAPAASAGTGDITIVSVSPPTPTTPPALPANAGQITVKANAGSQITSMTVQLFAGQKQVFQVGGFAQIGGVESGGPGEEIWQLPAAHAVTTQQLPAGTYTATVDATDSQGPQESLNGGSFPFLIQPSVTLSAKPPSISYTQQTVEFSGQATDIVPGTTSPEAFAGQQLQIVGPGGASTVTTGSNGDFQLAVKAQPDNYYASFQGDTSTSPAKSSIVGITAAPTPIRLAAKFARNAIEYGHTDEMTGRLRYYENSSTLKALPDTTVTVARLSPSGQRRLTAKTNSAGYFRVAIPRQTATGTWAATAGGTTLLGPALVTRTLPVHQTTGFRQTDITLSAFGALTVRTCLVDTSPGRSGTRVNSPIALQYRRGTRGRWNQLITIEPTFGVRYCAHHAPLWTISVNTPVQNAYYRLRFGGTQTLRVSVSKVRHLWREETRITQFKVSPHHAHANGAISVSGRLWRAVTRKHADSGSWTPYAGRKVAVIFVVNGDAYAFTTKPRTNSEGYFSGLFTAYETAQWLAQYDGDKTHFASASRRIKVTVSGGTGKLRQMDGLARAGFVLG